MAQLRPATVLSLADFVLPRTTTRGVLAAILVYAPLLLFVDARLAAPWPGEYLLGILTCAVLWWSARAIDAKERNLVWLCVAVATSFEVLGSLIIGAYRYRFGGIPLFVPFGHGLIYVFGTLLSEMSGVRRCGRAFRYAVLGAAVLWAAGGVAIFPWFTGRIDVHGLLWLPVFAYAVLGSSRRLFFAALFIATTEIELVGTCLGNWTWAPLTPWVHVLSGNPPSAIAGGYAIIDGSMLYLAGLLERLRELRIPQLLPAPVYVPVRVEHRLRRR